MFSHFFLQLSLAETTRFDRRHDFAIASCHVCATDASRRLCLSQMTTTVFCRMLNVH